jgi:hypothetical protein
MNEIFKKHSRVSIGAALIVIGVGPVLLAGPIAKLGFDTVGFALMWGLSFGAFFTISGFLVLIFAGVVKLMKLGGWPRSRRPS